MAKKNRTCYVCQEEYSYCPSCSKDYLKPTWMVMFHDENCKKIFETLQQYSLKELSAEEALLVIEQCDLSQKNKFRNDSKKVINELLAKKRLRLKERKAKEKVSEE